MWLTFGPTAFCPKNLISFKSFYLSLLLHWLGQRRFHFNAFSCPSSYEYAVSLQHLLVVFNQQLHFYIHLYICIYIRLNATTFPIILYLVRFVGSCVPVLKCCWCCCWWIAPIHLFRFAWLTWKFTQIFISIQILPFRGRESRKMRPLAARKLFGNMLCIVVLALVCSVVVVCLSSQFGIFDLTRFPLPLPLLLMLSSSAPFSLLGLVLLLLLLLLLWLWLMLLLGTFWTI